MHSLYDDAGRMGIFTTQRHWYIASMNQLHAQPPLMPDVGILAMPYQSFFKRWMGPHQMLTRLANYFHVLWLEPPLHWREGAESAARQAELERGAFSAPAGFEVHLPSRWTPELYRPLRLRQLLARRRAEGAWARLDARGCRTRVLHLWHPQFEPALATRHDLSLYHVQDDYAFIAEPGEPAAQELRVLQSVDQVFCCSPELMDRKGSYSSHSTFAPNGADYHSYSTPVAVPRDLTAIPHPRIGYVGFIKLQLDWPLLRELAARHSDWSFVFVGQVKHLAEGLGDIVADMARLKNVHFLGEKPAALLATYPQHFDACIIPYTVTGYTNNVYPLKLHEYLAAGRPVVGSAIRSLQEFSSVVDIACTPGEWSSALARALEPLATSLPAVARRQSVARTHDWSERVFDIAETVCRRLGPSYRQRLRKLEIETPMPA